MLSWLQFSEDLWGPLRLFQYISVRSLGAGITALIMGFWIGPFLIRKLRSVGAKQAFRGKDEVGDLADLHSDKSHTPTMGGALIFISVLCSTLLWAEPNVYICTALITYTLLTGVGFADDYLKVSKKNSKGLPGKFKLLGQLGTTAVALFILLGPFANDLCGVSNESLGSPDKMREFWIPFVSYPDGLGIPMMSTVTLFIFFLITLSG